MKLIPDIPPEMPARGNAFTRGIGRLLLRVLGWRLVGEIPKVHKCVVAAAPHTSNWDFIVAMPAILALGIRASFLMKKEAFFWPCAGLFKSLGGIPTDRSASAGIVEQIASTYRGQEKMWVAITPEGTRSKVERWKNGFLRIAYQAKVPIQLVAWDYPSKTIHFGRLFEPTGDFEKDLADIRTYFSENFTGKKPEKQ